MGASNGSAPQDKDRRDARSQDEVCGREQHGAAQSLRLRRVLATAGTELLARSFHLKALLRGIECYPQWASVSGFFGSIGPTTSFEFAIAWPKLTVDVASALFDSAWGDHRG
jgi:hypothetical protein